MRGSLERKNPPVWILLGLDTNRITPESKPRWTLNINTVNTKTFALCLAKEKKKKKKPALTERRKWDCKMSAVILMQHMCTADASKPALHACTFMHTHTHIYVFLSHMTKPPYSQQKEITFCPMVVFSRHCRRDACLSLSLRAKRSHSPKCWCTTTVWRLTLQLPWRRAWAAAQALKASCIISWCVDTLAFSSIHCDSDAFSAQSRPPPPHLHRRRGDDFAVLRSEH